MQQIIKGCPTSTRDYDEIKLRWILVFQDELITLILLGRLH